MVFSERSIDELTKDDIDRLIEEQIVEDSSIEFKREVEVDSAGRVRDASRNDVAREIVAFANSDGGALVIGIDESDDDPKRAAAITPLINYNELAERLRRAIYEGIEPKLPILHSRAIEIADGAGVIVFTVPHSHRAPHRVEATRECYRRVGSESRKMTMREIQELTLAVAVEGDRLNKRFVELHHAIDILYPRVRPQMNSEGPLPEQRISFIAVPLNPLGLRPVAARPDLAATVAGVGFTVLEGQRIKTDYPWGRTHRTSRPIVRGEHRSSISSKMALLDEIRGDGSVVLTMLHLGDPVFLGWILNQIATLLVTIDKMRNAAGAADTEYAIELSMDIKNVTVLKLGGEDFMFEDFFLETGFTRFPRYSYGTKAERAALVEEIAQDILHSVGSRLELTLNAEVYGPGA